ncbi:MAG: hypothetical protein U9N60_05500, partial [Thermodesulfobacteriota bacterium]|nr:hypothetical protein [Thermodesulfobacteriota bacterium]
MVVPFSSLLSTWIAPLWLLTVLSANVSPNPGPYILEEKNGLKIFLTLSPYSHYFRTDFKT